MKDSMTNLPMRTKVGLAFTVILLVALVPSLMALRGLVAMHAAAVDVQVGWLPATRLLGDVGRSYARLRISDTRVVVSTDPKILERGKVLAAGNLDVLNRSQLAYALLPLVDVERQATVTRDGLLANYMKVRAEVARLAGEGERAKAAELWFGDGNLAFRAFNASLDRSITETLEQADATSGQGQAAYRTAFHLLLGGIGLAITMALVVGLFLCNGIAGPIAAIADDLRRLAAGDLSVHGREATRRDEVGEMARAVDVFRAQAVKDLHREAELQQTNSRFNAALTHMSQGLCLYDGAERLLVVNQRFLEIYGLSAERVAAGCCFRDVLDAMDAAGHLPLGTCVDVLSAAWSTRLASCIGGSMLQTLANGRTVAISYEPTAEGGWVATYEDVTERQLADKQVVFLARHDGLTRLPNRVLFHERVEQALAQVGRGTQAAVLCLDLDRFKAINDTLGHSIGDLLLQQVADRLQACVREVDTVARFGGDEFAIVQIGLDSPADAELLARRIVDALGRPYDLDGHHVVIGTSVGVTLAPNDGNHLDALLKNADMALYRAKLEGRGTYRFFEPEMDDRLQARRALELDLRDALATGQFEMFYQPLVNLTSDQICGFEALMRWHHPTRGLVSPAEFIPVAEEIGLIVPLGEWALNQACMEAASWPGSVKVAVNLSPVQFKSGNLVQAVNNALDRSGLSAQRLELEITETVLLQNNKTTLATLHDLRDLGVHIAMDDFGTGYSSLSYLRSFPFDKIKIDQSFVRDLCAMPDSIAIVRAVATLGSSLGMMTTAEGVETHEQLAQLRVECCTEVQGYLLSRPCPSSDVADLLRRSKEKGWLDPHQSLAMVHGEYEGAEGPTV
jgi:diguanylate cyclase (GGDEF)-like protein